MRKEGIIYFARVFFPVWMDDRTNGWMVKASRKMTTTSFTISNNESKHNILALVGKANKERGCNSYLGL
jgi:hypothetical protein